MYKPILIFFILLLLCSCAKEHDKITDLDNNHIAKEIVGIYDANNQENETTIRNYHYTSSPEVMVSLNWDFFIDDNPCVFNDHIVAIISFINHDTNEMGLEVGSNCYDRSKQGPDVIIDLDDIKIKDDLVLNVYDLVNIYYEFPKAFIPQSYVDYLNYATLIEKP